MRLDKYISYALAKTRNEARSIIKHKDIKINDKVITKNDFFVDEYNDIVTYLDEVIAYKEFIYIMLNKPKGYLCATKDNQFSTVLDLVEDFKKYQLFISGRLDIDSEGFVLLTNDGKFVHNLTSPKKNCPKVYYVEVTGKFEESDQLAFEQGMLIYDGNKNPFITKPAILETIDETHAYITITEGKYHQIKKMCLKQNKEVTYLKRIKIGSVSLDPGLKTGEYRFLTLEELQQLKK